jgi:Domain of unknown function (DUF4124)
MAEGLRMLMPEGIMKSLLVVLIFIASAAQGEIYTWTDPRGTAHYTNSIYEVPARFRDKVKVLDYGTEQKGGAAAPQQLQPVKPEEPAAAPKAGETPMPPNEPVTINRGAVRRNRR